MKKLSILRCGDQNYWAYYWIAQENARYSQHSMMYAKHDEVKLDNIDIVYIHGPDITNYHATQLPLDAMNCGIKVIGGYSGNPEFWSPAEKRTYINADLIVTISPQTYAFCKFHYTNLPIIFMPESIDTQFFAPKPFNPDSFVVGWAGGIHKKIKRAHLLQQLNFPVLTQSEWKEQRYATGIITLDKMVKFYHSIDALVVTSLSECQPRVVMEAMSTGLPVISTDVGSIRMLIEPEWIVPVEPETDVVKQMNEKLQLLKDNPDLRKKVGQRNLDHVKKYWSWTENAFTWDRMFEHVYNNRIDLAKQSSDAWFDQGFKNIFDEEYQKYYNLKYK